MNKQKWIDRALQLGLDELEIYQTLSTEKEFIWFEKTMDTFVTSKVLSTNIRAIKDGNIASIAIENVDDEKMDEVLKALLEQTEIVQSEENTRLTEKHEIVPVEKTHHFDFMSVEEVEELLGLIEQKALAYDERIAQVAYLGFEQEEGSRQITNSLGVDLKDEDAVQYVACSVAAMQDGEFKDATKIKVVFDKDGFDADEFVKEVCDEALFKLGARSIPSRTCPVIFEKDAMTSLFAAFAGMFSGESIARGISPLTKEIGKKVFSGQITVVDDPRSVEALSNAAFDDEGFPTSRKVIVDHGVFEQPLHSAKSAAKMNTVSTGNGFGSGVSPMNMWIVPGERSLEQMMADMKDGLVITDVTGLHAGLRFTSTQFSLQAGGYWVRDGKKSEPVTLITVAGRFLDLMNDVQEIGNDLDWSYKQIVCPSIWFRQCAVSGE